MGEGEGARRARTPTERLALGFATLGGAGYLPLAPGTWGTLASIPLYLIAAAAGSPWIYLLLLAALIAAGIPAATTAERLLGLHDAGPIVIDEAAGFLVTMFLVPMNLGTVVAGFFLFRFFDVVKVFPADRLERAPGGLGIMADDLVSGMYANLALHLGLHFLPVSG